MKATALNVRSTAHAGKHDNILGVLHHGEQVDGIEGTGDWVRTTYKGAPAYIHGAYVEVVAPQAPPAVASATKEAINQAPPHVASTPPAPDVVQAAQDAHPQVAAVAHQAPEFHTTPAANPVAAQAVTTSQTNAESNSGMMTPIIMAAKMGSLVAAVEAGQMTDAEAVKQFVAYDLEHNGGMPSASGLALLGELMTTLNAHTQSRLAKGQPHPAGNTVTAPAQVATTTNAAPHADDQTFTTFSGNEINATTHEEAKLLNDIRFSEKLFDPLWLLQAQKALNVTDATGAMNTETLRAMRARAKDDKLGLAGIQDLTFLQGIHVGEPFVAATDGLRHGKEREAPNSQATTPADRAAQRAGYKDYNSYYSKELNVDIMFLGRSAQQGSSDGRGTQHLSKRLQAAESFLRQKYGGSDEEVIRKMGWSGAIGAAYQDDAATGLAHPHTMGVAIDIDAGKNPWIFNKTKSEDNFWPQWFEDSFARATRIYGGEGITAQSMFQMSEHMSTEELFLHISKTSDSFHKYMELGKAENSDEHILDTMVAGGKYTRDEARADLKAVRNASKTFHGKDEKTSFGRHNADSITNIKEDMLIALRDVGGLAWGGTEMHGVINGDFMHFDCRFDVMGHEVLPGHDRYQDPEPKQTKAKK